MGIKMTTVNTNIYFLGLNFFSTRPPRCQILQKRAAKLVEIWHY